MKDSPTLDSASGSGIARRDLGLPAFAAGAFVLFAVALSLFQLYTAGVRPVGLFYQRGFHLAVVEATALAIHRSSIRRGIVPRIRDSGGHVLAELLVDLPLVATRESREELSPIPWEALLAEHLAHPAA